MSDLAQGPATDLDQMTRLAAVEARVDVLVSAGGPKAPWFKNASIIVSLAAFFISAVTTGTSAYRTYRQDVEAQKTQLRAAIMQLNSVRLQGAEFNTKYSENPRLMGLMSILHGQTISVARQAYALVKEVGDEASATDLLYVGMAISEAGELALGEELVKKSLGRATNASQYVGAARQLSVMKLAAQELAEAESYRQAALHVYDIFPKDAINQNQVNYAHAYTNLYVASHSSRSNCTIALTYLTEADAYVKALGAYVQPGLIGYRNNVIQTCSKIWNAGVVEGKGASDGLQASATPSPITGRTTMSEN
jgi:hypothetical protein